MVAFLFHLQNIYDTSWNSITILIFSKCRADFFFKVFYLNMYCIVARRETSDDFLILVNECLSITSLQLQYVTILPDMSTESTCMALSSLKWSMHMPRRLTSRSCTSRAPILVRIHTLIAMLYNSKYLVRSVSPSPYVGCEASSGGSIAYAPSERTRIILRSYYKKSS